MKYSLLAILLLLFSNALQSANNMQLIESKEGMQAEMLKITPIGSSANAGTEFLKNNGFMCHLADDKLYTGDKVSYYINCFYAANPDKPMEKYWAIILIHSDDALEYIDVKYEDSAKPKGTLYTITSSASTRSTIRNTGTITFNNSKNFTLGGFLLVLQRYLDEYENIKLSFKIEDIPYAIVKDYSQVALSELLSDFDKIYRIRVKWNHKVITISKDW